jgi:hypothetical protein
MSQPPSVPGTCISVAVSITLPSFALHAIICKMHFQKIGKNLTV